MANWNQPTPTTLYDDLIDRFKDRDVDLAVAFSPDYSTATEIPVGTIRWNPTQKRWEIRNVSNAWVQLTDRFAIDVETLEGQSGAYYLNWNNFTNKPSTFPAAPHNHDDRYYTETEADGRFAGSIDTSGNNIRLKARNGSVLTSLTVPYATNAGNATTVNGHQVNQNLRMTDAVSFGSVYTGGDIQARGDIYVGQNTGSDSRLFFYDDNDNTWRSFLWDDSADDFVLEDNGGTMRRLFHEGHLPTWAEVSGKPSTFAPTPHGHLFDGTNRLQIREMSDAQLSTETGVRGELIYNNSTGRIHVMNGSAPGGWAHARLADIPPSQDLSNYARKDQVNTFTQAQTFSGAVSVGGTLSSGSLTVSVPGVHDPNKIVAQFQGDSDSLQIRNQGVGDYEIVNSEQRNGIQIFDGASGVSLVYAGSPRLQVEATMVKVVNSQLQVSGNLVWHAGNMGSGSGLDADTLDGLQAAAFAQLDTGNTFTQTVNFEDDIIVRSSPGSLNNQIRFRDANADRMQLLWATSTEDVYLRRRDAAGAVEGEIRIRANDVLLNGSRALTVADEGAGNGLDADTLDGLHASAFLSATNPSVSGTLSLPGNWSLALSGSGLLFSHNGNPRMRLATDGTLTVSGDIVAFGNP